MSTSSAIPCKTLVFDFDSTLIAAEGLELLAAEALRERADARSVLETITSITNMGMRGEIPLEEALARRLALISLNRTHVAAAQSRVLSFLSPSVRINRDFFTAHADAIYIVSGGFVDLIYPISDALGIDRSRVYANAFVYDRDNVVGIHDAPTAKKNGKAITIMGLPALRPIVMVGDGYTDYEVKMLGAADSFIAYTETVARDVVTSVADSVVGSLGELRQILSMSE